MELDFTSLDKLFVLGANTPVEGVLQQTGNKPSPSSKEGKEGSTEATQGEQILQRQADANRRELELAKEVYREYQENIKTSELKRAEILKGVKMGENIYSLFLKAVNVISLMTNNQAYYTQVYKDIQAIYGVALLEPEPLELMLEEIEQHINRLKEAEQREEGNEAQLSSIKCSIEASEKKRAQILSLLKRGNYERGQ